MKYDSNGQFITRHVNLKSGVMKIPDYENNVILCERCCLVNWKGDTPEQFVQDEEKQVKVRVPVEKFMEIAEVIE